MDNMDKKHISKEEIIEIKRRLWTVLNKFGGGHKLNFSKKINSSSGNIEAWFSNDSTTLPGFKALRNIAYEYGINLNWLILGDGTILRGETPNPDIMLEKENERLKGQIAAYEKILGKLKK
ncbi:MAG: hypothetical protein GX638_02800 [Crenarchaeota archaeon]|nr:hypothetical protein [Thermoproteota archaeon]